MTSCVVGGIGKNWSRNKIVGWFMASAIIGSFHDIIIFVANTTGDE